MAHTAHQDEYMMEELREAASDIEVKAKKIADLIRNSKHAVAFTGAGISTSSGIPDFRGPTGVWTLAAKGESATSAVDLHAAMASPTHMALVALHRAGLLKFIISQNVDGLHRKSGIPAEAISELHGNTVYEQCDKCNRWVGRESGVHGDRGHFTGRKCIHSGCTGRFRDTIINFGENLPQGELTKAFEHSEKSDLMLCFGSSLTVSPACHMPKATKDNGGSVVICNLQRTPLDSLANIRVHTAIDELMVAVMRNLRLDVLPFVLTYDVFLNRVGSNSLTVGAADDAGVPFTLFTDITAACGPHRGHTKPSAEIPHVVKFTGGELSSDPISVRLAFFGHYGELPITIELPEGTQSATYRLQFDVRARSWMVTCRSQRPMNVVAPPIMPPTVPRKAMAQPCLKIGNTYRQDMSDADGCPHHWSMFVDVPRSVGVRSVQFALHPTFEPPTCTLTHPERENEDGTVRYSLNRRGWGIFPVPVEVHLESGHVVRHTHQLSFDAAVSCQSIQM